MHSPPFPEDAVAAARDTIKAELRIDGVGEDAAIERVAATSLALGEGFTGQSLIVREWTQTLSSRRGWQLLRPVPVVSIDAVEVVAVDGEVTTLASDAYAIDIDAEGRGWVRILAAGAQRQVRVTLTAGIAASWADLPAPIAQGVTRMAAHLLEAREGALPPAAVSALWRPWRRLRLARERRA